MNDEIIDIDASKNDATASENIDLVIPDEATDENKVDNVETIENKDLKKKNKKLNKIPTFGLKYVKSVPKNVCIIGIIIFFVLGLLLGKMFFSKNYCAVSTPTVVEKTKLVADGKNNITEVGGFKYKIPDSYIYDKSSGYLFVYDKEGKYKISIRGIKASYDDLTLSKVSIRESVKEQGYIVNDIKELIVNKNNYIVLEVADKANKHLDAFTGLNDYVMYVDIVTSSNEIDESILNVAEDIIRNAEVLETTNSIENSKVVDIADISIKTASEYKKATNK